MIESPSAWSAQAASSASAAGVGVADSRLGTCAADLGRRKLRVQLCGDLRALIALMGQLDELGLDLRTEQGAKLFGIDIVFDSVRRDPVRPGRRGRIGVSDRLRTVTEESPQRDPQRQLGFLESVQLARLGSNPADDLGPIELGPARRIDRQRELVMDPAGKRTSPPVAAGGTRSPCDRSMF